MLLLLTLELLSNPVLRYVHYCICSTVAIHRIFIVHPSYLREAKSKFLALDLHEIKNGYPMITIFNKALEMLPPHNWVTHLHHGEYVFTGNTFSRKNGAA